MEHIAYALLSCLVVAGVDWALIDGFRASLAGFRDVPKGYEYRRFVFPRLVFVIAAGLVMYLSAWTGLLGEMSDLAAVAAIVLFILLVLYPQVVMFTHSKPYQNK